MNIPKHKHKNDKGSLVQKKEIGSHVKSTLPFNFLQPQKEITAFRSKGGRKYKAKVKRKNRTKQPKTKIV